MKIWDIDKKKGWTFEGRHSNQINHVLLWDDFSAFSSSADKTIRHFDIRDWGNPNENFTEDSETLNGYQFSKYFMGHKRSITNILRLHNSHTRLVSSSEDASIKIWDLYANQYCDYSNSNIVGNRFNANTEVIEPLLSLEGENEHQSGIGRLCMNSKYLASFSLQDCCLIVRDWERPKDHLLKLENFNSVLGVAENKRSNIFDIS